MQTVTINPGVAAAVEAFNMPAELHFGETQAPVMFRADFVAGQWRAGELLPYGPIAMDPSSKVLHYGQEIFEGMKAYRVGQPQTRLFRPERNWQRFNRSAARMHMPEIPQALFMAGVNLVSAYSESFVPGQNGQSLYLRPFMFATEPSLHVSRSNQYTFMVVASPSEGIQSGSLKVLIEREYTRTAPGGVGNAKTGGNYAASFFSAERAQSLGYAQTLWLDPRHHQYIEELSVMNFFAVIDGELHTPALSGSFLEGITRDSLIDLARHQGLVVHERSMAIDELIQQIQAGQCTEAFCCGTAAILLPFNALGEADGTLYPLPEPNGRVALQLKQQMLDIQEGRAEDVLGWMAAVPEVREMEDAR